MAKKKDGVGAQLKTVGANLSNNEALKIAEATGKSIAQVMSKAQDKGIGLGSNLIANYNASQPDAGSDSLLRAVASASTPSNLRPLAGLSIPSGTSYLGSSSTTAGGRTTYTPIVQPKAQLAGRQSNTQPNPDPNANQGNAPPVLKDWNNSIDSGTQSLIDGLTKTIADNQANIGLFMGTIGDLMKQMNSVSQQKSVAPYAVTTERAGEMAPTAQLSQTVVRRQRPMNNSLAITPVSQAMGTGLNIAV